MAVTATNSPWTVVPVKDNMYSAKQSPPASVVCAPLFEAKQQLAKVPTVLSVHRLPNMERSPSVSSSASAIHASSAATARTAHSRRQGVAMSFDEIGQCMLKWVGGEKR